MNPSEDPSDRLVDALLKEQSRGKADDALLREIEAKLGAAPHSAVARHRSRVGSWLAAAAALLLLSFAAVSWVNAGRKEKQLEADRAAVRESLEPPAGVVVGNKEGGLTPLSAPEPVWAKNDVPAPADVAPSDFAGADPSPGAGGFVLPGEEVAEAPEYARPPRQRITLPRPGEARGSGSTRGPIGKGSTTLREFSERSEVMEVGEGFRVRGLSFPGDPAFSEVFAHDPEAPAGTPGTRIEVKPHLAGGGQLLLLKGDRVILSDLRDRPEEGNWVNVFGSLQIPREATEGILLFLPGPVAPGQPARTALFLDASPQVLPPGSTFVINLSPAHIRIQLEQEIVEFKAGERKLIEVQPIGRNGNTSMRAFRFQSGGWRRIAMSVWPAPGALRMLQIIYENPASGMTEIRSYRDPIEVVARHGRIPNPPADATPLLDDLRFIREESTMWYVEFGIEAGGKWGPKLVGLTFDKKRLKNRVNANAMLTPGEIFFAEGAMAGRFKFIGFIEKQIANPRINALQWVKFARYEDLKENKKGEIYESQMNLPDAQMIAAAYRDRTAVLELAVQGQRWPLFKVEERTEFALPPDAPEKRYFLKDVNSERIVIEHVAPSGEKLTREIRRDAAR